MYRKLRETINEKEFDKILNRMLETEINSNLLLYTNQLKQKNECSNYVSFLYELVRFIARISVMKSLKPENSISDSLIEEYLPISSNSAISLEKYFSEHNSFEKVKEHFDEMREVINLSVSNIMYIE